MNLFIFIKYYNFKILKYDFIDNIKIEFVNKNA